MNEAQEGLCGGWNIEEILLVKIGLKVMGCRLNHAEAAAVAGALEYEGHEVVGGNEQCDVLVLHTCAVTKTAQNEAMRLARSAKRNGTDCVIMSGCTASIADTFRIFESGADAVVGKGKQDVECATAGAEGIARIVLHALSGAEAAYLPRFASTRASVKVQDGCNFRCAYCIVPDARGEPKSRPFEDIMREIAGLAANGYKEIVLTGVNVACWSEGGMGLAELAQAAARVEGVARIRLSSVEPGTAERSLVDLMAVAGSGLCHTLHYPLQSGDARVLRAMLRRYTPQEYMDAVEYALSKVPRLGLGADVITGFPGEDDAAFENTVKMIERYPFGNLHVFPYSERPGTPAADMTGYFPMAVRRERARELIAVGERKKREFAESFVNSGAEVLVERVDSKGVGRGWTSEYVDAQINVLSYAYIGKIVSVKVIEANGTGINGVPVKTNP